MSNDSGRPKSEWEFGLENIQIGKMAIKYVKSKQVTSFSRAIAMKDESDGDLFQLDMCVISNLARYHVHKLKTDRNFTY